MAWSCFLFLPLVSGERSSYPVVTPDLPGVTSSFHPFLPVGRQRPPPRVVHLFPPSQRSAELLAPYTAFPPRTPASILSPSPPRLPLRAYGKKLFYAGFFLSFPEPPSPLYRSGPCADRPENTWCTSLPTTCYNFLSSFPVIHSECGVAAFSVFFFSSWLQGQVPAA